MSVYKPIVNLPGKKRNTIKISNGSPKELLFEPTDCLVSDTLYLSKLPANIRESDIRTLLQHCMPIEISIEREKDIGRLRFSQAKYADRAYSLYNGFTFTNNTKLELQMYQDKRLDPEAKAALLEINGLPEQFDDNKLYDLFRPFGPLNLCKCVMKDGAFKGTAFIQFFHPYSSNEALAQMDGKHNLSVVPFMPSKPHATQQQQRYQEESLTNNSTDNNTSSNSDPNSVDIMNLYIKNLAPEVTNAELARAFQKYGRIISARVMTDPKTGQSKGFGFVSFGTPKEAAEALAGMNGFTLCERRLAVAYHEPKKGKSSTQNHQHQNGSQYHNANHNNMGYFPTGLGIDNIDELGGKMDLDDLSIGQKPAVPQMATISKPRHHPLTSLTSSPTSGASNSMSLASLAQSCSIPMQQQQQQQKQQQPHQYQQHHYQQQQQQQYAVHNERPTLRRRGSLESVMTESSANKQRIKLEEAVRTCGNYGKMTTDIVDMLLTLNRKERSLCLFNPEFLRDKVGLALEALETCNESETEEDEENDMHGLNMAYDSRNNKNLDLAAPSFSSSSLSPSSSPSAAVQQQQQQQQPYYTPIQRNNIPSSRAIPIISPAAKLPGNATSPAKSADNAASPAKLSGTGSTAKDEVDTMLNSFQGKPIHEQKQMLGDKLFPLVKSTGTKLAPKVTIYLLDTVDLNKLAHVMLDPPTLKKHVEEAYNCLQSQS